MIKSEKNSTLKSYILFFTYALRRGIPLELTSDMSFPSFIQAVKRFVSRQGIPDQVTILKHLISHFGNTIA